MINNINSTNNIKIYHFNIVIYDYLFLLLLYLLFYLY